MTKRGLNIIDLLELSPLHRQVVRLLLREKTLSEAEVHAAFPDDQPDAVSKVLDDLVRFQWLDCSENQTSSKPDVYHLRLEHTPASETLTTLWEKVDSLSEPTRRTYPESELGLQRGGKRKLPKQIWDRLDDG